MQGMATQKAMNWHCSVEATLGVLGGKYKAIIVWHLKEAAVMRFSEIQKAIPQATAKMLSQQLRELEADGIVNRRLFPVIPPKTEYSLTQLGQSIVPVVDAMSDWGHLYFKHIGLPAPCPED